MINGFLFIYLFIYLFTLSIYLLLIAWMTACLQVAMTRPSTILQTPPFPILVSALISRYNK